MQCAASVTAGSSLVVFTTNRNNLGNATGSNSFTIGDTDGNVFWPVNTDLCYTQGAAESWACASEPAGGGSRANIAWIVNSATRTDANDVISVSWSTGATFAGMWVVQWTGQATDVWDGSANAAFTNAGGPQNSGAASGYGTNSSDLVLTFCASSVAVNAQGGFTSLESSSPGYLVEYATGPGNSSGGCGWSGTSFSVAIETLTLRPSGSYPGIYVRQHSAIGGSNDIDCKLGITGTPGGTLLFQAAQSAGVDTLSLTDSASGKWTPIISRQGTTCQGGGACITGYLANAPANLTWTKVNAAGGDNGSCNLIEVAGIATSTPLDQFSDGEGTTSPFSSGNVSTTAANEIAIGTYLGIPNPGPASPAPTGNWIATSPNANHSNVSLIATQNLSGASTLAMFGTQTGTGTLYWDAGIATFEGIASSPVNGASFAAGAPVAPGSIVSIFGSNLANSTLTAGSTPLPTTLLTTSATINGVPLPLYYVSPIQINAQVPFETAPGAATLLVTVNGVMSPAVSLPIAPTAPGIFQYGANRAVAVNPNGGVNASNNPAKLGDILVVYLTGQGAVSHPTPTGAPALADPLSESLAATTATIGGTNAEVAFSGLAPGFVGLLQVNIQIPNVAAGDQPLVVTIGGVASNSALITVASQ